MNRSPQRSRPVSAGICAPYPVWLATTLLVRGAQLGILAWAAWYLAALFDAMSKPHTVSPPPVWLLVVTVFIGAGPRAGPWRWKLSPVGDAIAKSLASHHCPACGQDIYDPTWGHGFAIDLDRQAFLPSRICANCGHDLATRAVHHD